MTILQRKYFIGIGLLSVILMCSSPCKAFLGFGDIVYDPSVWAQTVMTYAKEIETASNTARQIENQLQSLQNQARNLQSMNPSAANGTMAQIQSALSALATVRNNMRGITMDYTRLQSAYDGVYKNFSSYNNGTSAKEYANQAQGLLNQSSNSAYDAMRAQGLTAQIGNDTANLKTLMQSSQSASGALAATQAGNQLSGMTVQQLMRLQEIVATSYRAQSSYFAAESQKKAMADADSARFFKSTIQRPLQGSGNGPGTKQY